MSVSRARYEKVVRIAARRATLLQDIRRFLLTIDPDRPTANHLVRRANLISRIDRLTHGESSSATGAGR